MWLVCLSAHASLSSASCPVPSAAAYAMVEIDWVSCLPIGTISGDIAIGLKRTVQVGCGRRGNASRTHVRIQVGASRQIPTVFLNQPSSLEPKMFYWFQTLETMVENMDATLNMHPCRTSAASTPRRLQFTAQAQQALPSLFSDHTAFSNLFGFRPLSSPPPPSECIHPPEAWSTGKGGWEELSLTARA